MISAWAPESAGARDGARQRAFEARHRREQLLVGQRLGADLVGEEQLEAQKSKNTVSSLPCSTMFHSSTPCRALRAISVARRAAGTSVSTGSSALRRLVGKIDARHELLEHARA